MISVSIIVIITVLASLSSFISSAGKVADGRRRGIRYITRKGWITIGLNATVVVITVIQFFLNEQKDRKNKREQDIKDSISRENYTRDIADIKKRFDTTNINIIEQLAKYGFKADSANNRLVRIVRDSSKTKIISGPDPVLIICPDKGIVLEKVTDSILYFNVSYCSQDASSSAFNLKNTLFIEDSIGNTIYHKNQKLLPFDTKLPKDGRYTSSFNVPKVFYPSTVYLLIQGAYKNYDGSKKYPVNVMYRKDSKTNIISISRDETRDEYIKRMGK